MAPIKVDQATIVILDVGKNVGVIGDQKDKSFFEKAKECTSRILERNIISQTKNLVGILLLGSKKTNNNMAEECPGAFKRLDLLSELQTPTWKMIRNLPEAPFKSRGDWFDALIVAADHFKFGTTGYNILNKKIILMTNFESPTYVQEKDITRALEGFKEDDIEVDIIGVDIYEGQKNPDIEIAERFLETTNGATATFDLAKKILLFHKRKVVNASPWNADLSIGSDLKIPVSVYIKLKDESPIKSWTMSVKDAVTNNASSNEGIIKERAHINPETQTKVNQEDVIKGYHYGQQIIPFTDNDKEMLYKSGDKSLSVYGFTEMKNIKWENLCGDSLYYVFGKKGDKKAQHAIRTLVEVMHELKIAGVVRRVYNNGNAPRMFALMPVIDSDNYICLSMVTLCFKEDIKVMGFPPTNLKKYACTDEQVEAFKDLIKAMDLTKAYDKTFDDTEAFPVAETVSPLAQYMMDCIAFRALNPEKPLPPPRDDIMMLFKTPSLIEKQSRVPLEKIKKLFALKKVEVKEKKKTVNMDQNENIELNGDTSISTEAKDTVNDMPKVQLPVLKKVINEIGSVDPVGDFNYLKHNGKCLKDLTSEFTKVIENLIYYNLNGDYSKALESMACLRSECVQDNPAYYNDWMQTFNTALNARKRIDIIKLIQEKKLNYILKVENSTSTYDESAMKESQAYDNDTIPESAELTIESEVNDMFDEM